MRSSTGCYHSRESETQPCLWEEEAMEASFSPWLLFNWTWFKWKTVDSGVQGFLIHTPLAMWHLISLCFSLLIFLFGSPSRPCGEMKGDTPGEDLSTSYTQQSLSKSPLWTLFASVARLMWFFFFFLEWAGDKNLLGSSTYLAPLNWVGQVACILLVTGKMRVMKRLPSPLVFTVVFRLLWEHLMEKLRFQWNAHLLLTVE